MASSRPGHGRAKQVHANILADVLSSPFLGGYPVGAFQLCHLLLLLFLDPFASPLFFLDLNSLSFLSSSAPRHLSLSSSRPRLLRGPLHFHRMVHGVNPRLSLNSNPWEKARDFLFRSHRAFSL